MTPTTSSAMTDASNPALTEERADLFRARFRALEAELGKMMVGQADIIAGVLTALFASGHVLLEGVPGLGKTMLVRTLAEALDLDFSRVQFTPDLMPADIVGTDIIREGEDGRKGFVFQRGPIFAHIVLADEINRATPKTQSALLEAMQERHVTVGGTTHPLDEPFLVLATQNPLEMEGTYPLPEAQLDRFLFKLRVGYPSEEELHTILDRTTASYQRTVGKVLGRGEILDLRRVVRAVPLAREVQDDAVKIISATHPERAPAGSKAKKYVSYGASPRGLQAIVLAAKIHALLDHRFHVSREDIRVNVLPALRHRVILNFEGEAEGLSSDAILQEILGRLG